MICANKAKQRRGERGKHSNLIEQDIQYAVHVNRLEFKISRVSPSLSKRRKNSSLSFHVIRRAAIRERIDVAHSVRMIQNGVGQRDFNNF